jgi:hypothetical protein
MAVLAECPGLGLHSAYQSLKSVRSWKRIHVASPSMWHYNILTCVLCRFEKTMGLDTCCDTYSLPNSTGAVRSPMSSALKALQEELAALRAAVQDSVEVARGGGRVLVTFYVDAPAEASSVDVDSLTVAVAVEKGAVDDCLTAAERRQHVHVQLPDAALPSGLSRAIASELQRRWQYETEQAGEAGTSAAHSRLCNAISALVLLTFRRASGLQQLLKVPVRCRCGRQPAPAIHL